MNDLARQLAADLLQRDPQVAELFREFETSQEEFTQLLELMGVRQVVMEIPPAGNAEGLLRANVSRTDR